MRMESGSLAENGRFERAGLMASVIRCPCNSRFHGILSNMSPRSISRKPIGMEPTPEVGRVGEFHLVSSFGTESHEVTSMHEQVTSEGRATPLYEFAQGMCDYGASFMPPPRIYLVLQDGTRVKWTGGFFSEKDVASIEFVNAGPGLSPEDTVIIRHGGGNQTRGKYGRGISVTLTYLASQGMSVEIESNLRGKAWKAVSTLCQTESGITDILAVNGSWTGRESNQTIFRVLSPDRSFFHQLSGFSNYFLPANPNYSDALLVEKNPDAPIPPITRSIGSGRVMCLDGIVDWEQPSSMVYVDGLKVSSGYVPYLFPWSFESFRGTGWPFNVERSYDSRAVEHGDPAILVQVAMRHCRDKRLLKILLEAATEPGREERDMPGEIRGIHYEIPSKLKAFDPATLTLLAEIWNEEHGSSALIVNDTAAQNLYERLNLDKKVLLVRGTMYEWLKEAGIPTAEQAMNVTKTEHFVPSENIEVSYADDADRLEHLFAEAGESLGTVRLTEMDGRKAVEILFPYAISSQHDFFDRKKPGAQWVRVAALIAQKEGLGIDIISRVGKDHTTFQIAVTPAYSRSYRKEFNTVMTMMQGIGEEISQYDAPNGITLITLTGDALQALIPPPSLADFLLERANNRAEETLSEKMRLAAAIPQKAKKSKEDEEVDDNGKIGRRKFLLGLGATGIAVSAVGIAMERMGALDSIGREIRNFADRIPPTIALDVDRRESIGSSSLSLGVHEIEFNSRDLERERRAKTTIEHGNPLTSTNGYYREFTGTQLAIRSWIGGRIEWVSTEKYEGISVASTRPETYRTAIRRSIHGESRLMVRQGEVVVAAVSKDSTPVEILREPRLGNYVIRGFSSEVLIYTAHDPSGSELLVPPIDAESAQLVDPKDLEPFWQMLIATLRASRDMESREKAAILLAEWGDHYYYNDNTSLDHQVEGRSVFESTAKIINLQEGICNTSATGYVALLRAVGIPARVVSGWLMKDGGGGPHMWSEFWDGDSWVSIESLFGSEMNPETAKRLYGSARSEPEVGRIGRIAFPKQPDETEQFLAAQRTAITAFQERRERFVSETKAGTKETASLTTEVAKATGWAAAGVAMTRLFDRIRRRPDK